MFHDVLSQVIAGILIAVILGTFGIIRIRLARKNHSAKANFERIFDWYKLIDKTLDLDSFNLAEVDSMSKDISHYFKIKPLDKYILSFNDAFRDKFLHQMGIRADLRMNVDLFAKYARLDSQTINVQIDLLSSADKRKYSILKMPYRHYWNIIETGFINFYSQYKQNWANLKSEEKKYTLADVEVPITLLRLYFKR